MSATTLFGYPVKLTVEVDGEQVDLTPCIVYGREPGSPAISVDPRGVMRRIDEHRNPSEADWRTVVVRGRRITLEVDDEADEYGQFAVRLFVDGKERYVAHFTDRAEDCVRPIAD